MPLPVPVSLMRRPAAAVMMKTNRAVMRRRIPIAVNLRMTPITVTEDDK